MSRSPTEDPRAPRDDDMSDADDATGGVESGGDYSPSAEDEITRLKAERDDLFNRLARATADFQNSRKRLEADKDQALQFANSKVITSLLPVIDNFERALAVDPAKTDVNALLKGMQIVHNQWLSVLAAQNVEQIAPEPGAAFDPSRHQAIMQQPSDKYKEPAVTMLLQKGYALHGRTLRPAQVAVSKLES